MAYGSLLTDVVQSSTAGTPPQFNDGNGTQTGTLCRAWVKFVGTTGAVSASFNVGSVTRNSTGDYTVNFTNALADANYAWAASAKPSGSQYLTTAMPHLTVAPTTSALRVVTGSYATPNVDEDTSIVVFR